MSTSYNNLIALSQRVAYISEYDETRDCLDQNWVSLLEKAELNPLVIPNKINRLESYLNNFKIKGIVLTGGNDVSPSLYNGESNLSKNVSVDRDKTEIELIKYSLKNQIPLLAVCRGMHMINIYFGGSLIQKISNHVAIRHSVTLYANELINIFGRDVIITNSFHNQGISKDKLAEPLSITAVSEDGIIEAIHHREHRIMGIQWHPERASDKLDVIMLKNFF